MNEFNALSLASCFDNGEFEFMLVQSHESGAFKQVINFTSINDIYELISPLVNDEWRAIPLFRRMLNDVGYYLSQDILSNTEVVRTIAELIYTREFDLVIVKKLTTHSPFPEWMKPEEEENESAAPVSSSESISVTNPRWEHVDSEIAKQRPDSTMPGDKVYLYVDVSGIGDGSKVEFDLSDMTASPVVHIITALGKISGGVGSAEWVVEDPRKDDEDREVKVEFSGRAREASSGNCEIPVETIDYYFSV